MTQEEEGGGEYDMYVCEYLAARHSFQGLQAVLRENALGFPPETTPAPVYRRLLWADCCALVAALRSDDSATGAYATLGKCATVLDRLLEQQEQEQPPPHDFKQGFALAAFDIFYQDLFRAYGVHADGARMAADVADLAQRCFRSQALLRAAQTALEGTVAAAQLRRDRDAFAALARAAHRHGVAALADAVEEYLRGVERGLAEPLVVQALRGVVRGTHAPQGPAPVAPAAVTTGNGAESTPGDKKKKRKSFSAEEIANLEEGVRRCGVGRWKEILALYHFDRRTTVDLKDKWRNIVNKRAREEQATQATQTTQKQSQESASAASSQTGSSSSTVTPAKRKRVGVTEDGLMALLTPPSSQGAATQDRTPSPASSQPRPDATAAPADDDDDDGEILSLACADGAAADAAADDDDIEDLLATQV